MSVSIKDVLGRVIYNFDGEDHVRISPFGTTQIGKYASLSWRSKFFIPQLGEFISPLSFISWLYYGDESYRHNNQPARIQHITKEEFTKYQYAGWLAKWHQLTSLHSALIKQSNVGKVNMLDLPWVEYKVHISGLKEFPKTQVNANILKGLVRLNVDYGNREGLNKLSEVIPNFELSEIQNWINETVREHFFLEPVKKKPAKA